MPDWLRKYYRPILGATAGGAAGAAFAVFIGCHGS